MITEEKNLLLKDLSARLPYGVKCVTPNGIHPLTKIDIDYVNGSLLVFNDNKLYSLPLLQYLSEVKPCLFPLSSMTENQKKEFNNLTTSIELDSSEIGSAIAYNMDIDINEYSYISLEDMITCIDWLNSHHFDYRGLIEKGLAIDATGLNIY